MTVSEFWKGIVLKVCLTLKAPRKNTKLRKKSSVHSVNLSAKLTYKQFISQDRILQFTGVFG